ncbi:MAG: class I SAM-dependent methyltransferase [Candidatus Taylorbacteria bacterium]
MEQFPKQKFTLAHQFDSGNKEYASFIENDPIRNFLHYPAVMKELGEIRGQRILDIGCGEGLFDRKLAKEYGGKVVGYDISPNLISKAKEKEKEEPLGVEYHLSDPEHFSSPEQFDNAVAVMVLPYSPSPEYLKKFFVSAEQNLKKDGKFIAVVFNPEFKEFDQKIGNRFFRASEEGKVNFDFLDLQTGEVKFNAMLAQFPKKNYEDAARESGLEIEWKKLFPIKEGINNLGEEFWKKLADRQPYALIVAKPEASDD